MNLFNLHLSAHFNVYYFTVFVTPKLFWIPAVVMTTVLYSQNVQSCFGDLLVETVAAILSSDGSEYQILAK